MKDATSSDTLAQAAIVPLLLAVAVVLTAVSVPVIGTLVIEAEYGVVVGSALLEYGNGYGCDHANHVALSPSGV